MSVGCVCGGVCRYNKAVAAKKERASHSSQNFGAKGTRGGNPSQVTMRSTLGKSCFLANFRVCKNYLLLAPSSPKSD